MSCRALKGNGIRDIAPGCHWARANTLSVSDFLIAGDHLLVTDSATGFEWLSPFATRGITVNTILGGYHGLLATEGFRYGTSTEVDSMIDNNFDNRQIHIRETPRDSSRRRASSTPSA